MAAVIIIIIIVTIIVTAVGLLLKLLDCLCHELLQTFCPNFFISLCRSSRLATSTQPYLLAVIEVYNLLDICISTKILGSLTEIWKNEVCIRMLATLLDDKLFVKTFSMLCICRM